MAAFFERFGKAGRSSWQAKVRLNGVYRSKTFAKKSDAVAWATSVESSIYEGKPVQQPLPNFSANICALKTFCRTTMSSPA